MACVTLGIKMTPTAFDEENAVLDPPVDMTLDECSVLSVYKGNMQDGTPVVISCWKPTKEEWEEIQKTGRVWLIVYGNGMPPVALTGNKPFN